MKVSHHNSLLAEAVHNSFSYIKDSTFLRVQLTSEIADKFDVFGSIRTTPVDLLLAQKIAAFCQRKQPKGRDIYDITFLCAKTRPNYAYLQQRLAVTNAKDLKETLHNRLAHLDLAQLSKDVAPFLFNSIDAQRIMLFPQFVQQTEF